MDIQEENKTEQQGDEQAPQENSASNSDVTQGEGAEAVTGAGGDDQSQPEPEEASVQNQSDPSQRPTPGQLPDQPEQLKSLVHERDQTIVDLRKRNQDLQSKLAEKEKVVTALTKRLEQAAEQLDRLHRSGADRGGKILSGIPVEVIEEQRELIDDLKSAIQHWEDLQSTSAMGRFEAQIRELREMLAEQLELKEKVDRGGKSGKAGHFQSSGPKPDSEGVSGKATSSWDQMKAQLLGDSGSDSSTASPQSEEDSDVMIPGAESEDADEDQQDSDGKSKFREKYESEFEIDIPERPADVENFEEADAETLRAAVKERDRHIDKLTDVIEALKELSGHSDMEAAKKHRKELEERLEKAEAEMKEKLRQAEIEMSMERAKLAREAAQLRQMGSGAESTNKAGTADENGQDQQDETASEDKGSRWSRFLGSK